MKTINKEYEVGDIVFVSKYNYDQTREGQNHLFVIIDENKVEAVPIEYFGMIVSSHRDKGKDKSNFQYNEPLDKNNTNGLNDDSIVKCDVLYAIPLQDILFKIGSVDVDDYLRFIEAYSIVLKKIEDMITN